MRFVIVTRYFEGLGFAMKLQKEGHEVLMAYGYPTPKDNPDTYHLPGKGMVEKKPLGDVMEERLRYRGAMWVWDGNHNVYENELLRREGYAVFGGGEYAYMMEHDRQKCVDTMERYGIHSPPSHEFEGTEQALAFVKEHPDQAYAFKPYGGESFETWIPTSKDPAVANMELQKHLMTQPDDAHFMLQEMKQGIEMNVEVWYVRGEPKFAMLCLESKHNLNGDMGALRGCAFDYVTEIPLQSEAIKQTLAKLHPMYKKMNYTGFGDVNVIVATDGVWFLEKCERFGYNSHPNLLMALLNAPLGETLASLIDGSFKPQFKHGFGSSVTVYQDKPSKGKLIQYSHEHEDDLYWIDSYVQVVPKDDKGEPGKTGPKPHGPGKGHDAPPGGPGGHETEMAEEKDMYTAGFNELVAIAHGHGATMQEAWGKALAAAKDLTFSMRAMRTDGDGMDYASSPIMRYEKLKAMGWVTAGTPDNQDKPENNDKGGY